MKISIDLPIEDIKALNRATKEYNLKSGEKHSFNSFIKMLILKELPGHELTDVNYQLNQRKKISPSGDLVEYR